jgi:PIN domain nuclease of toxin-antitoxin system
VPPLHISKKIVAALRDCLDDRIHMETDTALDEEAVRPASLPPLQRDPFDRLLIAQAILESLAWVTLDPAIRSYPRLALLPAE